MQNDFSCFQFRNFFIHHISKLSWEFSGGGSWAGHFDKNSLKAVL